MTFGYGHQNRKFKKRFGVVSSKRKSKFNDPKRNQTTKMNKYNITDTFSGPLKDIIPRRISFHGATKRSTSFNVSSNLNGALSNGSGTMSDKLSGDSLILPTKEIFDKEIVHNSLRWKKVSRIGPGLYNLGNTCFMNATLQCLTYTPALAQLCIKNTHGSRCRLNHSNHSNKSSVSCLFCILENHIARALSGSGQKCAVAPKAIAMRLRLISRQFRLGRQEDAHEFLRELMDKVQIASLKSMGLTEKKAGMLAHSTQPAQIFGGFFRSQVACGECPYRSNKYDPFMDVSLELRKSDNLKKAFRRFTSAELLDQDNKWYCEGCKKKVCARKQLSIKKTPNCLTLLLKRFSPFGMKITNHIAFDAEIDLKSFTSDAADKGSKRCESMMYDLYGVVVHSGYSAHAGHYYSYVKASNGMWYCMDDASVSQVNIRTVLSQKAYMLFYTRRKAPKSLPKPDIPSNKMIDCNNNNNDNNNNNNGVVSSESVAGPMNKVQEDMSSKSQNELSVFAIKWLDKKCNDNNNDSNSTTMNGVSNLRPPPLDFSDDDNNSDNDINTVVDDRKDDGVVISRRSLKSIIQDNNSNNNNNNEVKPVSSSDSESSGSDTEGGDIVLEHIVENYHSSDDESFELEDENSLKKNNNSTDYNIIVNSKDANTGDNNSSSSSSDIDDPSSSVSFLPPPMYFGNIGRIYRFSSTLQRNALSFRTLNNNKRTKKNLSKSSVIREIENNGEGVYWTKRHYSILKKRFKKLMKVKKSNDSYSPRKTSSDEVPSPHERLSSNANIIRTSSTASTGVCKGGDMDLKARSYISTKGGCILDNRPKDNQIENPVESSSTVDYSSQTSATDEEESDHNITSSINDSSSDENTESYDDADDDIEVNTHVGEKIEITGRIGGKDYIIPNCVQKRELRTSAFATVNVDKWDPSDIADAANVTQLHDEIVRQGIKETANWRRSRRSDLWDETLDAGKLKKVKEKDDGQKETNQHSRHHDGRNVTELNVFQRVQDGANTQEEQRRRGETIQKKPYIAKRLPVSKRPIKHGNLRGGFSKSRGGRGGFSKSRGGRGGFSKSRGGRGGFSKSRGGRGGFSKSRGGRGGFSKSRGGRGGGAMRHKKPF